MAPDGLGAPGGLGAPVAGGPGGRGASVHWPAVQVLTFIGGVKLMGYRLSCAAGGGYRPWWWLSSF